MPSSGRDTNHEPSTVSSSEPLVSVVTPVHNTADYLADCIRSVLAQSYQAWEYVIVNNASTDRSLEIAESFAAADRASGLSTRRVFCPRSSTITLLSGRSRQPAVTARWSRPMTGSTQPVSRRWLHSLKRILILPSWAPTGAEVISSWTAA